MIRLLRYLFLFVVAVALVLVASANRGPVTVHLLPPDFAALVQFDWTTDVPVFLVLFGGILIGLLVGFIWEWLREYKHRRVASTKTREVSKLERELAAMKDQNSLPDDDVLAILEKPKA